MHLPRSLASPMLLLGLALIGGEAFAGDLQLQIAAWDHDARGSARDAQGAVDFDTLGVEGKTEPYARLFWRQEDGSWWPDLALTYCRLRGSGSNVVREPVTIGGIAVLPGGTAAADADVHDTTLTLSYPLLRRVVAFDAGLSLRTLAGDILIRNEDSASSDRQHIDPLFPLLTATLALPIGPRFSLVGNGSWISRGNDVAYELYAGLDALLWRSLSLQAGWMRKRYDVEQQDYRLDATLGGLRAGLSWRFE